MKTVPDYKVGKVVTLSNITENSHLKEKAVHMLNEVLYIQNVKLHTKRKKLKRGL